MKRFFSLAALGAALLSACAPRLACNSMSDIVSIRGQLADISADDGIDQAEATKLAWFFAYTRVSTGGELCGPVLKDSFWTAEFKAPELANKIIIRIDADNGGATSPGLAAAPLGEANRF